MILPADVHYRRQRERINLRRAFCRRNGVARSTAAHQKMRIPLIGRRIIRIQLNGAPKRFLRAGPIPFVIKFDEGQRSVSFESESSTSSAFIAADFAFGIASSGDRIAIPKAPRKL